VTWPSHTSMITGTRPDQHGILSNRRPKEEGGDYYWSVDLLRSRTLWQAAEAAGWRTAAITWPVTVDAGISLNLPEAFAKRRGGGMDLPTIDSKATPGLVDRITAVFPSFPQEWMDDRTRTLATVYFLKHERPALILLHLVDHDAEAHEKGPFSREANALIDYSDELLGQIMQAMPKDYVLAVVSDHGFERTDRVANLRVLQAKRGASGTMRLMGGLALADDEASAKFLREAARNPAETGVGREIPKAELNRFAPKLAGAVAAFEPAPHFWFGNAESGELFTAPREPGSHGLWPLRQDYRSVYLLWGNGVRRERLPEIDMLSIANRLATILELPFQPEK
jgi:hypothetical protein